MKRPLMMIALSSMSACSMQVGSNGEDQLDAQSAALSGAAVSNNQLAIGSNNQLAIGSNNQLAIGSNLHLPLQLKTVLLEITSGETHSCVRTSRGDVYCWGDDGYKQSGGGGVATTASSPYGCPGGTCVDRPHLIANIGSAAQIDAGRDHTCSRTSSGQVYCWGGDTYGQLGLGHNSLSELPTQVAGGLTFSSIGAGEYSSCGIVSSGVYCWGYITANHVNSFGFRVSAGFTPVAVFAQSGGSTTLTGYDSVSVGMLHACALTPGSPRDINCWGDNYYGQAGFGSVPSSAPTITDAATQVDFTCADMSDGTVSCVGSNNAGQLGNASLTASSTSIPQTVGGGMLLHGVSVGVAHACALDPSGAAYCWGGGSSGQLGTGGHTNSSVPVAVGGYGTYKAIAAGFYHTCAIGTDNNIWCWGGNAVGQIGDGSQQDHFTPAKVSEECIFPDATKPCPT